MSEIIQRRNVIIETTHHDGAIEAANGSDAELYRLARSLVLQISGTSTSRTIQFRGSIDGTNFVSMTGMNLTDYTNGTSTTGSGELWQFDVTGLTKFRADLTAVSGGNVTCVSSGIS